MRAAQRLGKQLQRVRTSRGLTQEQLAVNVGLSRTFITRLELGQYDPTLSTLVRLAKMFVTAARYNSPPVTAVNCAVFSAPSPVTNTPTRCVAVTFGTRMAP